MALSRAYSYLNESLKVYGSSLYFFGFAMICTIQSDADGTKHHCWFGRISQHGDGRLPLRTGKQGRKRNPKTTRSWKPAKVPTTLVLQCFSKRFRERGKWRNPAARRLPMHWTQPPAVVGVFASKHFQCRYLQPHVTARDGLCRASPTEWRIAMVLACFFGTAFGSMVGICANLLTLWSFLSPRGFLFKIWTCRLCYWRTTL